jgi:Cu(I)/Ag(I) efflux system periplasmic protein CusF
MKILTKYLNRTIITGVILAFSVSAFATGSTADGEIRKIDKESKRLTIKHGEIKDLDMPPMTMVFDVKDGALLDKVKPGDKIKFRVVKEGRSYVVTDIITP